MHLLLIVTLVITFPLDQVLQSVVTHAAIQYSLDLILFLAINESWEWGWSRSSANGGVREHEGLFDYGEYGV
jgi:heme/copper-type cytochrome/quinol oxidase subunit 4